jgi:hypothetical protein
MNYKILGEGGGRKVFDIGNGLVKKVAKNQDGINQNLQEIRISETVSPQKDVKFNPVIEYDPEGKYIICPFVKVFKTNKELFDNVGLEYDEMEEYEFSGLDYVEDLYNEGDIEFDVYDLFTQIELLVIESKMDRAELAVYSHWGKDFNGNLVIVDYGR